jgi:hypothetical protein
MIESYLVDFSRLWRLSEPGAFWDVLNELPVNDSQSGCCDEALKNLLDSLAENRISLHSDWKADLPASIVVPRGCRLVTVLNRHSAQVLKTRLERLLLQRPILAADIDESYVQTRSLREEYAACLDCLRRQVTSFRADDDRLLMVLQVEETG